MTKAQAEFLKRQLEMGKIEYLDDTYITQSGHLHCTFLDKYGRKEYLIGKRGHRNCINIIPKTFHVN